MNYIFLILIAIVGVIIRSYFGVSKKQKIKQIGTVGHAVYYRLI